MSNDSKYYGPYKVFDTTLKAWFIAYGVGAPILFLSNDSAREAILQYESKHALVLFFLGGAILQVMEALIYKHAMWHQYMAEEKDNYDQTWLYKLSVKVSEAYRLGVMFDVLTIVVYALGTGFAIDALMS